MSRGKERTLNRGGLDNVSNRIYGTWCGEKGNRGTVNSRGGLYLHLLQSFLFRGKKKQILLPNQGSLSKYSDFPDIQ